jgi:glycosyltransferase involved in cell wall biosynthesis
MEIVIYYEQFAFGGVDKHLKELINNWPNKNDKITVITNKSNPGFKKIKKFIKRKIFITYYNSWSYTSISNFFKKKKLGLVNYFITILQPFFLIVTIYKFIYLLKSFSIKTVILSNNGSYPGSWANIGIIFAAKLLRFKKRIMLIHHAALPPRKILSLYYNFIDIYLSKALTDIICVSNATLQTLKKNRQLIFKKLRSTVIYNDLKLERLSRSIKFFDKIKKKFMLFGIIGRVELYKGHEDIIRAIARINIKKRSEIKLLIIGECNFKTKQYLIDLSKKLNVNKNIIFTGFIDGNSEEIIKNLDVVITATRDFEGFGYTALEAIKLGIPLISTNVGGLKEFVNPKYTSLIKPNNIYSLADIMLKIKNNYKLFKNKAKIYQKKSNKNFTMSKNFRRLFI